MTRKTVLIAGILVLLVGILIFSPVEAQQPTPSADRINALAREMYCPVCENIPLDVCPTQACAQWRDLIKQKMEMGWSDQQIMDYFVAQYGDRVLAQPPAHGLNWLIYLLPPIFIALGVLVLFRLLIRMKRQPEESPVAMVPSKEDPIDPFIDRMEEELKRYKKL